MNCKYYVKLTSLVLKILNRWYWMINGMIASFQNLDIFLIFFNSLVRFRFSIWHLFTKVQRPPWLRPPGQASSPQGLLPPWPTATVAEIFWPVLLLNARFVLFRFFSFALRAITEKRICLRSSESHWRTPNFCRVSGQELTAPARHCLFFIKNVEIWNPRPYIRISAPCEIF